MTQTTSQVEAAIFQIMGMVTDYMLTDQPSNTQRRAIETALRAALRVPVASPASREKIVFDNPSYPGWLERQSVGAGWAQMVELLATQEAELQDLFKKYAPDMDGNLVARVEKLLGAGVAGMMDARPDSFHSDSGECDRVQGLGPTDAERYQYMIDCDFQAVRKYVPTLDEADYKARLRAKHDAAILAKGGDRGEGK